MFSIAATNLADLLQPLGGLDRLHARVPNVRGGQGLKPLRGRQSRQPRTFGKKLGKAAPWPRRRPQPADGARRFARKSGGSRSRNKAPVHRTCWLPSTKIRPHDFTKTL
jgi:hypothetical protein